MNAAEFQREAKAMLDETIRLSTQNGWNEAIVAARSALPDPALGDSDYERGRRDMNMEIRAMLRGLHERSLGK